MTHEFKAGDVAMTRDGTEVRVIYDKVNSLVSSEKSLVVLKMSCAKERAYVVHKSGRVHPFIEDIDDLMPPKPPKKLDVSERLEMCRVNLNNIANWVGADAMQLRETAKLTLTYVDAHVEPEEKPKEKTEFTVRGFIALQRITNDPIRFYRTREAVIDRDRGMEFIPAKLVYEADE